MTIHKFGKLFAIAITSLAASFPIIVAGQVWPTKPIKIMLGFSRVVQPISFLAISPPSSVRNSSNKSATGRRIPDQISLLPSR